MKNTTRVAFSVFYLRSATLHGDRTQKNNL